MLAVTAGILRHGSCMAQILFRILLRSAACVLATYVVWRWLGAIAFPICAPLFGIALARPLIDLLSLSHSALREKAFAPVSGRHFEFRGLFVDIAEDADHYRWIRIADVRKVIEHLPRDLSLRRQFPDGCAEDPESHQLRIQAEALLQYLAHSTHPDSLRFRLWLERDVILPAQNMRRRLGIHENRGTPMFKPSGAP